MHPSPQNGLSAYKMLLKPKLSVRGAFWRSAFSIQSSRLMDTFRVRLEEKWSLQCANMFGDTAQKQRKQVNPGVGEQLRAMSHQRSSVPFSSLFLSSFISLFVGLCLCCSNQNILKGIITHPLHIIHPTFCSEVHQPILIAF